MDFICSQNIEYLTLQPHSTMYHTKQIIVSPQSNINQTIETSMDLGLCSQKVQNNKVPICHLFHQASNIDVLAAMSKRGIVKVQN